MLNPLPTTGNNIILMFCSLYRLPDIPDNEKPDDYTYKFSPCETFVCDPGDAKPDAKVSVFVCLFVHATIMCIYRLLC